MNLAFVTSLRHPLNSADYRHVERLLEATLVSIRNQSDSAYVVIIVGHRTPQFELAANEHFVEVDYAAPVASAGPQFALGPFVFDKGTKVGLGLSRAADFGASHAMICDADDFVHRDLARFVRVNSEADGWVVRRGFAYSSRRNAVQRLNHLNRVCGTSHIVNLKHYRVPSGLDPDCTQDQIADAYGDTLAGVIGAHRNAVEWFRDRGVELAPLPFRGSVYHLDTGENHSGKQMVGIAGAPSAEFREVFGLSLGVGAAATRVGGASDIRASLNALSVAAARTAGRARRAVRPGAVGQ